MRWRSTLWRRRSSAARVKRNGIASDRERHQALQGVFQESWLLRTLNQISAQRWHQSDGTVQLRIRILLVGANADQFFRRLVKSEQAADLAGFAGMLARGDGRHDAADAVQDRDWGIVILRREAAIEHNVAIEQGARGIHQGVVLVVAFHQNGIEAGDAAGGERPRAFDEAGEQREDRRRVALGGGWFASGESDFALGHRQAGQRVDYQQNVPAMRAEVFCDRRRRESGTNTEQWILIGSGDHDHGAVAAVFAQRVQQFANFPAALADETDYAEVRPGVAGHHADERALADAAAAEDAHALAAPARQESVNGSNAATQGVVDWSPFQGEWRLAVERVALPANRRRVTVDGKSSTVQNAAEKTFADAQRGTASPDHNFVAVANAGRTAQRHGKHGVAAESHDFAGPALAARVYYLAGLAHRTERSFGFDQLTDHLDDPAPPAQRRRRFQMRKIRREQGAGHFSAAPGVGRRRSGQEQPTRDRPAFPPAGRTIRIRFP